MTEVKINKLIKKKVEEIGESSLMRIEVTELGKKGKRWLRVHQREWK